MADLRGRRFGRLTVMKWAGYKYVWHCSCACGRLTAVTASNLITGHTTSCGCARIERAGRPARELTGRRFGKLKVIRRAANRGNHTAWICRCDCGKVSIIRTSNLTTGSSQSCGCRQRERAGRPKKAKGFPMRHDGKESNDEIPNADDPGGPADSCGPGMSQMGS